MNIAVASGKGGTGKTTVALNLAVTVAASGRDVHLLDCDVEEPNLHLFFRPEKFREDSVKITKPALRIEKCSGCGLCAEICKFNAIACIKGKALLFPELCRACGACVELCPEKAFEEEDVVVGRVRESDLSPGFCFTWGELTVGEIATPAVINGVKKNLRSDVINILDAAPGTSCPVVSVMNDADCALLVTEPTPFGLHDLKLAVDLVSKLGIPSGIIINRSDGTDRIIAQFAKEAALPVLSRIPSSRRYAELCSRGEILVESEPGLKKLFADILDNIETACIPSGFDMQNYAVLDGELEAELSSGGASGRREIVVLSGKGGTGKTTISAALAELGGDMVVADADVDASDMHLLLHPENYQKNTFIGAQKARIDQRKCAHCGRCFVKCRFSAVEEKKESDPERLFEKSYSVDNTLCQGCGLCAEICPADAVDFEDSRSGFWYTGQSFGKPVIHARLDPGAENSGKLVALVRKEAANSAKKLSRSLILTDGPPGVGCPAISSISGCDYILFVTEPSVSGMHDLKRVLQMAGHFSVEAGCVINKADINPEISEQIKALLSEYGIPVLAEIPFDENVMEALIAGKTLVGHGKGPALKAVREIWEKINSGEINGTD